MRRMATIQVVEEIQPIEDADHICAYRVLGWWVVDQINAHTVGDKVIFIEVDAWAPHTLAPFLSKGREPKVYNGIKGQRLKTVRLRKQISQGLLLSLNKLSEFAHEVTCNEDSTHNIYTQYRTTDVTADGPLTSIIVTDEVDSDVSELLGIIKYEPPIHASLSGVAKGNFPSFCPKTDQPRIQNMRIDDVYGNFSYEVTEKLDGSSCTIYKNGYRSGVCSRNLDLEYQEGNAFCFIEVKYKILSKLYALNRNIAIQGEVIGPNIQGNKYALTEPDFYVFDIYDIDKSSYLPYDERKDICDYFELKHCPVEVIVTNFDSVDRDELKSHLLECADGVSLLHNVSREGLVFKSLKDPNFSFKAISTRWLLQFDE